MLPEGTDLKTLFNELKILAIALKFYAYEFEELASGKPGAVHFEIER